MREGVEVKIENRENLRPEEIMQILQFFQKEYPIQTPEEICESIMEYLRKPAEQKKEQKVEKMHPQIKFQPNADSDKQQMFVVPQRKTKWMRQTTFQEQKAKYEEQRYIAKAFCEHGVNYHLVAKVFPNMLPKTYRCYVQAANNQAVNDIIDFLRYECNVQIEKLNRDQKRSMRTQLTKVRQWLGNRDISQLQTYFKFIHRHYNKSIEISYQEAIKLYKTLILIIKSPYVNVMEVDEDHHNNEIREQPRSESQGMLNPTEEKAVIIEFIKSRDLAKVSDSLCQTYEYSLKWSIHSVKHIFKGLLAKATSKLVGCLKKLKKGNFEHYFTTTKLDYLFNSETADELKIKLLSYYMEKRTNYNKVNQLIDRIHNFYQIFKSDDEEEIELPKIQTSVGKIEIKKEENVEIKIKSEPEEFEAPKKEQLFEEEETLPQDAKYET